MIIDRGCHDGDDDSNSESMHDSDDMMSTDIDIMCTDVEEELKNLQLDVGDNNFEGE